MFRLIVVPGTGTKRAAGSRCPTERQSTRPVGGRTGGLRLRPHLTQSHSLSSFYRTPIARLIETPGMADRRDGNRSQQLG
jgi:hypothetical protein